MAIMISLSPGGRRIAEPLSKPTDEIMHVLRGRLTITVEDQTYTLDPGDYDLLRGPVAAGVCSARR